MTPDDSRKDEQYAAVGRYHAAECKRLFDLLVQREVRFEFEQVDDATSLNVAPNGSWGWNFMIIVYVHADDQKMFHQVHKELFG